VAHGCSVVEISEDINCLMKGAMPWFYLCQLFHLVDSFSSLEQRSKKFENFHLVVQFILSQLRKLKENRIISKFHQFLHHIGHCDYSIAMCFLALFPYSPQT
jgi:hypothetical protein